MTTRPDTQTQTPAGLSAQTASESADVWLVLLTLRCAEFDFSDIDEFDGFEPGVLRFVANEEDIVSRGLTFLAWGFDYQPPAQGLSGNEASLRMDNVDRRITAAIRSLPADTEINCHVEFVLASDPDLVERDSPDFLMSVIDFNAVDITATIGVRDDSRAPLCSFIYGRAATPGLHA